MRLYDEFQATGTPMNVVVRTGEGNLLLAGDSASASLRTHTWRHGGWIAVGQVRGIGFVEAGGKAFLVDDTGTRLQLAYSDRSVVPHVVASVRSVAEAAGVAHTLPAGLVQALPLPAPCATGRQSDRSRAAGERTWYHPEGEMPTRTWHTSSETSSMGPPVVVRL